ncbi:hypothetical protein ABZZ74_23220 [Streptomyces sp. NPDC006476]|uniref:hypothetical protein n=1 Tax=Streptomyces sp. NPDC006476 TaxID=3157175 RepID=UPI0033A285FF
MSWRRLRVLIQQLPPESATWTALRNAMSDEELAEQADKGEPEKGRWSQTEQLLAASLDAIRRVEYVLICANTEKKTQRPEAPKPTPRPGAKPLRPKPQLSASAADFLFNLTRDRVA